MDIKKYRRTQIKFSSGIRLFAKIKYNILKPTIADFSSLTHKNTNKLNSNILSVQQGKY